MIRNHSFKRIFCLLSLGVVLLGITACADDEAPSTAPVISSASFPQLSFIAPPEPQYEEQPVLDDPTSTIWRAGYWSYNGSSFDWVSGEVMPKPSTTATWASSYWARREYGWAFVPGYWQ